MLRFQRKKTLRENHTKELEGFADYSDLKEQVANLTQTVTDKDSQLNGFYEQRKNVLKKLNGEYDVLNDERFSSVKDRFEGLSDIDILENNKVESFIRDFELIGLNKKESGFNPPKPKEQNKDKKEQAITKQHKMKAKTKSKASTPVNPNPTSQISTLPLGRNRPRRMRTISGMSQGRVKCVWLLVKS